MKPLTTDITHELSTIMDALHQSGKEPTLALVKARLSQPVPMPALITAIKSWKNSQKVPKVEIALSNTSPDSDKIKQLENQISALQAEVTDLKSALHRLTQDIQRLSGQ
ncbi:hypothetical protein N9R79_08665 [Vibrio sp.]|nr:hypothetical protein [Vibrio sp.]